MDGTPWQELCIQVLRVEHGDDLVPVPDRHGGDAGLEAFTTSGVAYQSYSPQGPTLVKKRYEDQRDKITTDVGKFLANDKKLLPLFGDIKIRRWVLLTPVVDSRDLIAHCTAQSTRIKEAACAYAAPDIRVLAQTLELDYAAALRTVHSQSLAELGIPDVADLDYSKVDTDLVNTMKSKLGKLPHLADQQRFDALVNQLLASNVQGISHRDYVRDYFPELDRQLEDAFEALRNRVEFELPHAGETPGRLLALSIELASNVARIMNAGEVKSQQVAYGQVAEWLMHCPLDFVVQD